MVKNTDANAASRFRSVLEGTLGISFSDGNSVQPLRNGDEAFPAMLEAIRGARHNVHFLTFAYWRGDIAGEMAQALAERADAGIAVRALIDSYGGWAMPRRLRRVLLQAGVELRWFRPLLTWRVWSLNNRTHRKVLVVDHRIAFSGGFGIAQEWQGDARNPNEWRDTHFCIQGPAVQGLQGAFLSNWAESGGQLSDVTDGVMPASGPAGSAAVQVIRTSATLGWSDVATVLHLLVSHARQRLLISTAYFVPNRAMIGLLCEAARRGVEVEIISPGPHMDMRVARLAGRATYQALLDAGVRIWEYQPTMLHTKVVIVDGVISLLGSANFNQRSMRKDDEVSLVVIEPELAASLASDFAQDRARSKPIDLHRWRRRGWWRYFKETVSYLFSDVM